MYNIQCTSSAFPSAVGELLYTLPHDEEHQVCGGGGRRRGQDVSPDGVRHRGLPQRVHPHRVRHIRLQHHGQVSLDVSKRTILNATFFKGYQTQT